MMLDDEFENNLDRCRSLLIQSDGKRLWLPGSPLALAAHLTNEPAQDNECYELWHAMREKASHLFGPSFPVKKNTPKDTSFFIHSIGGATTIGKLLSHFADQAQEQGNVDCYLGNVMSAAADVSMRIRQWFCLKNNLWMNHHSSRPDFHADENEELHEFFSDAVQIDAIREDVYAMIDSLLCNPSGQLQWTYGEMKTRLNLKNIAMLGHTPHDLASTAEQRLGLHFGARDLAPFEQFFQRVEAEAAVAENVAA